MKKLVPAILAVLGLAIGTSLGHFLKPAPKDTAHISDPATETLLADGETAAPPPVEPEQPVRRSEREDEQVDSSYEYVKLNNQFVVPVVSGSKVSALVVMSLSIEVTAGQKETVFIREPKLRDAFLQVLFNHANSGGFNGAFTTGEKMNDLRGSLFQAAVTILGPVASDVLVIDIVRQDV